MQGHQWHTELQWTETKEKHVSQLATQVGNDSFLPSKTEVSRNYSYPGIPLSKTKFAESETEKELDVTCLCRF